MKLSLFSIYELQSQWFFRAWCHTFSTSDALCRIGILHWIYIHRTYVMTFSTGGASFYCIPYGKCWLYSVVRRLLQVGTWLYRKTGRQTGSRLRLWSKYMLSQKTALPVLRVTPGAYLKVEFHLPAFLPGKCIRKTPGCSFPAHWPS